MQRIATIGACLGVASLLAFTGFAPNAFAARGVKVDCVKVMQELDSGKKPKEVAADMKISTSSVYKCRRRAHETTGGGTAHMAGHPSPSASPAAAAHP
jgi:hypothetical protein